MSTTTLTAAAPAAPVPPWRLALAVALLLGGAAGAWTGGVAGLAGAAALVAGGVLLSLGRGLRSGPRAEANAATSGRIGAELMVERVVPVWSRQMELTRHAASDGLSGLLQTFSDISATLHQLSSRLDNFAVGVAPGAVDSAVTRESPALNALTAASQRAFAQRDAAVAQLSRCADGLAELQMLAKQARELARHTRLVAFNATIESNRGGGAGGSSQSGNQAVASELRMLAGRIGETSEKIERVINGVRGAVRQAQREGEVADTSPEELQLEIDLRAREALTAMLGALGASLQGSAEVKQASQALAEQLESTFMHFQFGDRVSQMLSIIANDMSNFAHWVAANPRATQTDAAEWLTALEASYTMDEQRSSHHGNVRVDHDSAVEFF